MSLSQADKDLIEFAANAIKANYQYKETYRSSGADDLAEIPELIEDGVLSDDQMRRLQAALAQDWPDEKTEACDGTAWEFKLYENGAISKHRDLGYIYGIEPFETIASVLTEENAEQD